MFMILLVYLILHQCEKNSNPDQNPCPKARRVPKP